MAIETTRFEVLDHLKTPEDRFAYLDAAFEAGDPSLVAHALRDVARFDRHHGRRKGPRRYT